MGQAIIDVGILKAVALFASKEPERYDCNGVCLEVQGNVGQFNPLLAADFAKFSKAMEMRLPTVAHNGRGAPALVWFDGSPNTIGVLMPFRSEDPLARTPQGWACRAAGEREWPDYYSPELPLEVEAETTDAALGGSRPAPTPEELDNIPDGAERRPGRVRKREPVAA